MGTENMSTEKTSRLDWNSQLHQLFLKFHCTAPPPTPNWVRGKGERREERRCERKDDIVQKLKFTELKQSLFADVGYSEPKV